MEASEIRVEIRTDRDVVAVRGEGRSLARQIGFSATEVTLVATAISEVARNILTHAGTGAVTLSLVEKDGRRGILVVADDTGPGIADVAAAMQDGFSTGSGMGVGLPGARRLMDDFAVDTRVGEGTTVTMTKWESVGG